jgi:hypothetical protein
VVTITSGARAMRLSASARTCSPSMIGQRYYLFGFGKGKKWLLFLDKRKTATEGKECWRLYSQALAPKIAPDQPGPARPREMFVCEPARREPFVSGLSDWPRR